LTEQLGETALGNMASAERANELLVLRRPYEASVARLSPHALHRLPP
tara:strand:+ start:758 stop:898 length:141 start_codon:yes stop_codon:yes gene_type:complete